MRPGIVTQAFEDRPDLIHALVFMGPNGTGENTYACSPKYDEAGKVQDTWHWPIREMPLVAKLEPCVLHDWIALHGAAIKVCAAIEALPASESATKASILASELAGLIHANSLV